MKRKPNEGLIRRPRQSSQKEGILSCCTHYSKSQIFVQKFNFDRTSTFSRVFHSIFFWQLFSWNPSCQQLKSPKPQHFHEFSPQKIDSFLEKSKLNFGHKWRFRTVWLQCNRNKIQISKECSSTSQLLFSSTVENWRDCCWDRRTVTGRRRFGGELSCSACSILLLSARLISPVTGPRAQHSPSTLRHNQNNRETFRFTRPWT